MSKTSSKDKIKKSSGNGIFFVFGGLFAFMVFSYTLIYSPKTIIEFAGIFVLNYTGSVLTAFGALFPLFTLPSKKISFRTKTYYLLFAILAFVVGFACFSAAGSPPQEVMEQLPAVKAYRSILNYK